MSNMQRFMLIIIFISSLFSFAASAMATSESVQGDCCICQTGIGPKSAVPFFKLGCAMWMGQQTNCGYKDIHSFGEYDLSKIPAQCDGKTLKFGYVGHWGTSEGTDYYVQQMLKKLVQERNMSVEYENTACRSSDNIAMIANSARSFPMPPGKHFSIKGYQVSSVGMWEGILPGKPNLWAKYDTRSDLVEYPRCEEFSFSGCYPKLAKQDKLPALCQDQEGGLRVLTCCDVNFRQAKKWVRGEGFVQQILSRAVWVDEAYCGSTVDEKS